MALRNAATYLFLLFASFRAQAELPSEIKIGVIATLSRLGEFQGQQTLRGIEVAQEQLIDENFPIKLSAVLEDSQADPGRAVTALRKLLNLDRVKFIIGDSWNSSTLPLLPIVNQQKILLVSPAAALNQLTADDLFFRTMPSVMSMIDRLSRFAFETLKLRKIAIIHQENPFGNEHKEFFTAHFQSLGGLIVAIEAIEMSSTDVRTQLLRIKQSSPDGILNLHASGPPIGLVIQQAKQLGISAQWLSHFGSEDPQLLEQYGSRIESLYYPYPWIPAVVESNPFHERYQKKFHELPGLISGNAYDAVMVLMRAARKVGIEPEAMKAQLLSDKKYIGAFGPLQFDRNGDAIRAIVIKQIANGRIAMEPNTQKECHGGTT